MLSLFCLQVQFLTTGGGKVRFNPNLYNCGKVRAGGFPNKSNLAAQAVDSTCLTVVAVLLPSRLSLSCSATRWRVRYDIGVLLLLVLLPGVFKPAGHMAGTKLGAWGVYTAAGAGVAAAALYAAHSKMHLLAAAVPGC